MIVLSTTLLFANKGLWRHVQLRHEIGIEAANLAKLEGEEKSIQKQVELLKKEDVATIERIARERYAMQRPGEEIYFEEK
jgi:cell division protein FtsB